MARRADPRFILTQNEILTSREVLNPVIDSQDLQRKWATDGSPHPRRTRTTSCAA